MRNTRLSCTRRLTWLPSSSRVQDASCTTADVEDAPTPLTVPAHREANKLSNLSNRCQTTAKPLPRLRAACACGRRARAGSVRTRGPPRCRSSPDSAVTDGGTKRPRRRRPGLGLGLVLCGVPVRAGDPPSVRQDVRRAYCACGSPSGSIGMLTCRILDTMTMHKGSTWMATT